MDARTGLGRFREFRISNYNLMMDLIDYCQSQTIDQIMAEEAGKHTAFRSLELSCNPYEDNRESIYFDNMSWYGTGHVAPSMRDPRQVYDRLFGTKANSRNRNITDLALGNAQQLRKRLGQADQAKFEEYFEQHLRGPMRRDQDAGVVALRRLGR